MPILFGTKNQRDIYLGTARTAKVYLGTNLVWQRPGTLFWAGWMDGIEWEANAFPRPNYTGYGHATMQYVDGGGYMLAHISDADSTYTHYAVLSTKDAVMVPAWATKLCVEMSYQTTQVNYYISLVPPDAPTCIDTSKGGITTGNRAMNNAGWNTQSLTLTDAVIGKSGYHVTITARGVADAVRWLRVRRVWFE